MGIVACKIAVNGLYPRMPNICQVRYKSMVQAQAVPNQRASTKTLLGFGTIVRNQYEFRLDIVLIVLQLAGVHLPANFPIKAGAGLE